MIKNTFAPNCKSEYLTPNQLLTLCRFGFPIDRLPPDARKIADKMIRQHVERSKAKHKSRGSRLPPSDDPAIKRIRDSIRGAAPMPKAPGGVPPGKGAPGPAPGTDSEKFRSAFLDLLNLMQKLHPTITEQPSEAISTLVSANNDAKNDIIKKFIFNNLWAINTSWKLIKESEKIELGIKKAFGDLDAGLAKEKKGSRFDIKYAKIDGKHVIIDLKKPDMTVNAFRLVEQIQKYNDAMKKILEKADDSTGSIAFVCVLGRRPSGWKEDPEAESKSRKALRIYDANIVFYEQIIDNMQRMYREYMEKKEKINSMYNFITEMSNADMRSAGLSSQ